VAADDLYRLRFVSDPQISPNGSHVAYAVGLGRSRRPQPLPVAAHARPFRWVRSAAAADQRSAFPRRATTWAAAVGLIVALNAWSVLWAGSI